MFKNIPLINKLQIKEIINPPKKNLSILIQRNYNNRSNKTLDYSCSKTYSPLINLNFLRCKTNSKSVHKLSNKPFSVVEKIKLQDKIRLVDITEVIENSTEFAFEQLQFYLNKENFKSFIEDFQNYSQKGILLDIDKLNVLMGLSYTKNFKIIEMIQEYIFEKNIRLDSLGYNYVILATLKNAGFEKAYNLFIEASIFGVQQNLNVVVSLLSEIDNSDVSDKNQCINFILHHLQKFYSEEVLKEIKDLFKIDLQNAEEVNYEVPFSKSSRKTHSRSRRNKSKSINLNNNKKEEESKEKNHAQANNNQNKNSSNKHSNEKKQAKKQSSKDLNSKNNQNNTNNVVNKPKPNNEKENIEGNNDELGQLESFLLNLVEQDINKKANTDAKADGGTKVVLPFNNDDIPKPNINQENKKNKTDKESKDSTIVEKKEEKPNKSEDAAKSNVNEGEKKKADAIANSQKQDFDLSHLIKRDIFHDGKNIIYVSLKINKKKKEDDEDKSDK